MDYEVDMAKKVSAWRGRSVSFFWLLSQFVIVVIVFIMMIKLIIQTSKWGMAISLKTHLQRQR